MDEVRREHEVEFLIGEGARNPKLEKGAPGSILKLTKIRVSRRGRSEIEFEGEALSGVDGIFRELFFGTSDGHLRNARGDKELCCRRRDGEAGVGDADGVLENDDEEKSSESRYSDDRMEEARPDGGSGDARGYKLFVLLLAKDFACVVRKGSEGLEVSGTFGTVKVMLFVCRVVGGREFAENVFHGGLELYGLAMVHLCHPYSSAPGG
jgi:hypothetical protein